MSVMRTEEESEAFWLFPPWRAVRPAGAAAGRGVAAPCAWLVTALCNGPAATRRAAAARHEQAEPALLLLCAPIPPCPMTLRRGQARPPR